MTHTDDTIEALVATGVAQRLLQAGYIQPHPLGRSLSTHLLEIRRMLDAHDGDRIADMLAILGWPISPTHRQGVVLAINRFATVAALARQGAMNAIAADEIIHGTPSSAETPVGLFGFTGNYYD